MSALSAARVHELCLELLPGDEADGLSPEEVDAKIEAGDWVSVKCILTTFVFNAERLAAATSEIQQMALCMQDPFFLQDGGGWSFLQMAVDRDEVHWAEHPTMEMLCALMIGAGIAFWTLPSEVWPVLPGGMPYISIDRSKCTEVADA